MSKQVTKKSLSNTSEKVSVEPTKQVESVKQVKQAEVVKQGEVVKQVEEVSVAVTDGDNGKEDLTYSSYIELQNELSSIQERLSLLRSNLKKHYKLTSKQLQKLNKGKRQSSANPRSPTGFGKPCFVPQTLRVLLKLGDEECVTRPSVTKKLYEYIQSYSLYDKEDKRLLRVNDSLSAALQLLPQEVKLINSSTSIKDKQGLNFYNIQKYVAKLYQKSNSDNTQKTIVIEADTVVTKPVQLAKPVQVSVKKTK
jgi:hypothetical protein